ncbi:interleukin-6 receptor subunit alpha isoform X6 [Erinaceus europaeus]|uniref:Interleukin-6 receptor subunit alpha isoform X6 n=1 Tax=Erinaceus europaeus TaxID=9365 RepID=A0ABM3Y8W3_ERIEU|nr:interleukin-6 receptor subunit alpha isoform X6 [Erinaceus europaeus]
MCGSLKDSSGQLEGADHSWDTAGPQDPWGREMAGDVHSSLPGAHVVLTCPGGEPGRNSTVQWAWSSTLQGSLYTHHTLVLPDVQPSDSGSYSCFRDNQLAGTVHLLVEAPPEEPQLSCYQKCPTSNVMCEWRPQHPPSVTTKAVLLVKKSVMTSMEYFREPCWYSATSGTFSCKLAVQEADSSFYIVSACVANSVGSKSSQAWGFRELEILQPDPPVHVEVSAVAGKPRRLRVSWGPAPSWNSTYYRLRFQLRYRAERARDFLPPVTLQESQHHYEIPDAWSGLRHVVQLRAQEEFGNGRWSEWSQEVMGTPWTEPRSSPAVTREPPSTQAPTVHVDSKDILSSISPNTSFPVHFSPVPLPTFLVAGGSLTFGMLLCIAIVLRVAWHQHQHQHISMATGMIMEEHRVLGTYADTELSLGREARTACSKAVNRENIWMETTHLFNRIPHTDIISAKKIIVLSFVFIFFFTRCIESKYPRPVSLGQGVSTCFSF